MSTGSISLDILLNKILTDPVHAGSDSPAEYKHGAPDRADR